MLWDRSWSIARFNLALTDEEFFDLTPRQLHLLLDQHKEQTQQHELLAGIVACTIANHSFSPPKKALLPADYMPSQWAIRQHQRNPAPRLNRKQVASNIGCFLRACMAAQTTTPNK